MVLDSVLGAITFLVGLAFERLGMCWEWFWNSLVVLDVLSSFASNALKGNPRHKMFDCTFTICEESWIWLCASHIPWKSTYNYLGSCCTIFVFPRLRCQWWTVQIGSMSLQLLLQYTSGTLPKRALLQLARCIGKSCVNTAQWQWNQNPRLVISARNKWKRIHLAEKLFDAVLKWTLRWHVLDTLVWCVSFILVLTVGYDSDYHPVHICRRAARHAMECLTSSSYCWDDLLFWLFKGSTVPELKFAALPFLVMFRTFLQSSIFLQHLVPKGIKMEDSKQSPNHKHSDKKSSSSKRTQGQGCKKTPSASGQILKIADSYTLWACFSEVKGCQKGSKIKVKMEPQGN